MKFSGSECIVVISDRDLIGPNTADTRSFPLDGPVPNGEEIVFPPQLPIPEDPEEV